MFSLFNMFYPGTDICALNAGYADMSEEDGLFIRGQNRNLFDKFRL